MRIDDRGPLVRGRIIDFSWATALNLPHARSRQVRIERFGKTTLARYGSEGLAA
ncbi:hypothetical protein [Paraburkholderia sp. J41]|uniref:hypothetical protein n=1 Tax=Paraburkholderia sp. J41 TaxID=2805433 RepID=UPI002AC32810|nr:hypothetical protein [Paraburkholderia sp. J41]